MVTGTSGAMLSRWCNGYRHLWYNGYLSWWFNGYRHLWCYVELMVQ